ncbi:MAG: hypothetical protein H0T68_09955 [Gemmatimonadales bacterium]|nr:hypothetical protein [Gemmatimonadales bacterium]
MSHAGHGEEKNGRMSLGEAALKGALAASLGGLAMKLVWEAEQKLLPAEERLGSPTKGAVEAIAEKRDIQLTDAQASAGAAAFYGGTMAGWGAVFGMVQSRFHPPDALHGLLLGGILYSLNFPKFGLLPKLGVLPAPSQQSRSQAAVPIGPHIVFGLTTAAAFRALS